MPRFIEPAALPPQIADGVHVCKILKARSGISPAGNEILIMRLGTPSGARITSVLTFVERARRVVSAFCNSCDLVRPAGEGQEYELNRGDVQDRYLYVEISSEAGTDGSDPIPRVTRFLTRAEAIRRNPKIAEIKLQPQSPRQLRPINDQRESL